MARTISKNPGRDLSRLQRHARNHLGTIMGDEMSTNQVYRSEALHLLDEYYESTQYDDLTPWEDAIKSDNYVPVRDRKPRVIYSLPKALVNKVASKIIGTTMFPNFVVEDDDDDTAFFRSVQKAANFRRSMIEPIKRCLNSGSVFVRFYLSSGALQMEYVLSKYCYADRDERGELNQIEIKYVFEDQSDLNRQNQPKLKWYRIILTRTADIIYDTPDFKPGVKPEFTEVKRAEHGLGWVQGEWFCTEKETHDHDGYSLYADILDFCDELNYSLSQSSQAISYNQEPQLAINGMDEEEIDALIKSSEKAWNLGKEGKAAYVNSDLKTVEQASEQRDHMRQLALDVVRIVIHDPDKMAGNAQSGRALEILHGPLVELVDELRQVLEPSIVNLLLKISMTMLVFNARGEQTALEIPDGYQPSSVDITVHWPLIFPPTIEDIQKAAMAAQSLSTGQIISRKSLTRWIAQMIPGVDNIEEELKEIETQEPLPSPFGSFGDSGGGGF